MTALADPTRRNVFELLADQPRAVGELASKLPVSRPAVSQHLRVLKEAGLVDEERLGTRRVYSIRPEGARALRDYADRVWTDALGRYEAAAHRLAKNKKVSQGRRRK